MKREASLAKLLSSLFCEDELREHLAASCDVDLDLPGRPIRMLALCHEAATSLARLGAIDASFFAGLIDARPLRRTDIDVVSALWLDISAPTPPVDPALTRYRRALAAACGHTRIVGVPVIGHRPSAELAALFVPLRLRRRSSVYSTTALQYALTRYSTLDGRRIVILGEPGSGKTTLCRHLATTLARDPAEDLLPFHLQLRTYDGATARQQLSLREFMQHDIHARLSVELSGEQLDAAFASGRAVLLLDGIDEVGDAARRDHVNELVRAFAAVYPDVAIVVTSRISGYDEAPLPRSGPQGFACYRVEPFSSDDLQKFVHNWYALQSSHDAAQRQRDCDGLLAALDAAPTVRALTRNPLLATLIAMIYGSEARLPGDRPHLYERCIQTLLETWPAARGQALSELDIDVQRRCLELVAWRMLDSPDEVSEVRTLVARRDLLGHFSTHLAGEPVFAGHGPFALSRIAERWTDRLERETGLLVEQTTGMFGFLHRSFGEYLAACYLDSHYDHATRTHWLLMNATRTRWNEVAQLSLGRHPDDSAMVDIVCAAMGTTTGGRVFVARCLREGVALSDEQLLGLLDACLENEERDALAVLVEVHRFSERDSPRISAWFLRTLSCAPISILERLLSLGTTLGLSSASIDAAMRRRVDARAARALSLRLLPLVRGASQPQLHALAVGLWTAADLDVALTVRPGLRSPGGVLMALGETTDEACRIALAVDFTADAVAAMHRVRGPLRGLRVTWDRCTAVLATAPRRWAGPELPLVERDALETCTPLLREDSPLSGSTEPLLGYVGGEFACYADAPPWQFLDYFAAEDVNVGAYISAQTYDQDPEYWSAFYGFAIEPKHQLDLALDPPDAEGDADEVVLGNYSAEKIVVVDIHEGLGRMTITAVDAGELPPQGAAPWPDPLTALRAGETDIGGAIGWAVALHAAQVRISADNFSPSDGRDDLEWYATQRQVHTWLWNNWAELDAALPASPTPAQLGLYLTLGWTQQTTTHQWPVSERWRALSTAPLPEHPWPRLHRLLISRFDALVDLNAVLDELRAESADLVAVVRSALHLDC